MHTGWGVAALVIGGVWVGWFAVGGGAPPDPRSEPVTASPPQTEPHDGESRPRQKANAVDGAPERRAIADLEARVATLEARLEAALSAPVEPPPQRGADLDGPRETTSWFDEEGLRTANLRSDAIAALRSEVGTYEMERLTLRDRAVREGWMGTPRYREELQASARQTREDLGEDWYEWMLYASGRPTRVVVQDVLGDSPAEQVGLRPGDALRRYDEVPLYTPRELQALVSEGEEGEMVTIEVDREGEHVELYVPRGPLGIRLDARREAPATPLP